MKPLRPALAGLAMAALAGCSGAMMASVMPGEVVTIEGTTFTVANSSARGLTIQNFETGRTPPVILLQRATLAGEQVSGCPIDTIIKDGSTNTYYATLACPA